VCAFFLLCCGARLGHLRPETRVTQFGPVNCPCPASAGVGSFPVMGPALPRCARLRRRIASAGVTTPAARRWVPNCLPLGANARRYDGENRCRNSSRRRAGFGRGGDQRPLHPFRNARRCPASGLCSALLRAGQSDRFERPSHVVVHRLSRGVPQAGLGSFARLRLQLAHLAPPEACTVSHTHAQLSLPSRNRLPPNGCFGMS